MHSRFHAYATTKVRVFSRIFNEQLLLYYYSTQLYPSQKKKRKFIEALYIAWSLPSIAILIAPCIQTEKIVEKHFLSLFIPMSCSGRRKVFTATTAYHYYTYLKTSISPLLDRPLILCINKMTELRRCWVLFPPSCFKEGTGPLAYCWDLERKPAYMPNLFRSTNFPAYFKKIFLKDYIFSLT